MLLKTFTPLPLGAFRPCPPPQTAPLGTGSVSLDIKRPGHDTNHLLPFSAEIKNEWGLYLHSPECPYAVYSAQEASQASYVLERVMTMTKSRSVTQIPGSTNGLAPCQPQVQRGVSPVALERSNMFSCLQTPFVSSAQPLVIAAYAPVPR